MIIFIMTVTNVYSIMIYVSILVNIQKLLEKVFKIYDLMRDISKFISKISLNWFQNFVIVIFLPTNKHWSLIIL